VKAAWTVFLKELRDAVRDRRSWIIALTLAMLAGPVVFVLMSNFISGLEERVAEREVIMAGAERAPSLVGFLQRAGARVVDAPPDYLDRLRSGVLQNAVIRPTLDFEERLARGEFDLVAIGRALLQDPDWAKKVKEGRVSELRDYDGKALATLY